MKTQYSFALVLLTLAAAVGCGDDPGPADACVDACEPDSGPADSGLIDSGPTDSGLTDSGVDSGVMELCEGDDATGDTDADGVCDDLDACTGDDATGDADEDGVCDDMDACAGDDATGDADVDGVCDDMDACTGDDATGDADEDGVCDDVDACPGQDDAILSAPVLPPFDLDVVAVSLDPGAAGDNTVRASLSNGGANSLDGTPVTLQYSADGGSTWPVTQSFVPSGLGATCDTEEVAFTAPLAAGSGTVELCVRVNPQVAGDPDAADQRCATITIP